MMLWGEAELVGGATVERWYGEWDGSRGGVMQGNNRWRRALGEDSEGRGEVSVCG